MTIHSLHSKYRNVVNILLSIDGLGPLLLRLYLAPIFIMAGHNKLTNFSDTAAWMGNSEWGLGLPFPEVMTALAAGAEFFGGWLLLFGFATRLISIPLMVTMVVAALTVHWQHGWHILPESTLTVPWEWREDLIQGANERREMAISILKEYGNYSWLSETGGVTILKNGIEFTATYFIMLVILFFTGGGRYTSADYFLNKRIQNAVTVD
ncbi:DoxX family protein [Aestuariibacter sp. AA17]|uniref:DoxX family protein n=1 Tax=Fluctibacter corallii TaxID=2984329 RepID=A0ABT3A6H5_9ALTE|nr:DoxX family protein [Aestuariibacter sp. AA17]MCV2884258.1 DoxX family protein [Aestuariibacter sp. AA17]